MPDNVAARRTSESNGFAVSDAPGETLSNGQRELVMLRDLSHQLTASK